MTGMLTISYLQSSHFALHVDQSKGSKTADGEISLKFSILFQIFWHVVLPLKEQRRGRMTRITGRKHFAQESATLVEALPGLHSVHYYKGNEHLKLLSRSSP